MLTSRPQAGGAGGSGRRGRGGLGQRSETKVKGFVCLQEKSHDVEDSMALYKHSSGYN